MEQTKTNRERFVETYTLTLGAAMDRNPSDYFFPRDQVGVVAEKMVRSLAEGNALISYAAKSAAKKLGFPGTRKGFMDYLRA